MEHPLTKTEPLWQQALRQCAESHGALTPVRHCGRDGHREQSTPVTTWEPGPGVVELLDGRRVRGRSLRTSPPAGFEPDIGYWLLAHEPEPMEWPVVWIRWPDFRLPADRADALGELRDAFVQSASQRVEVACAGGRGRTGTAIAVLAVMAGVDPSLAVEWVRANYRSDASETPWQRRWIRRLDVARVGPRAT